jgi:hypothetical protein
MSDTTLILGIIGIIFTFWLLLGFAIYQFLSRSTPGQKATAIGFLLALLAPGWLLIGLAGFIIGLLFRPTERQLRFDADKGCRARTPWCSS